MISSSKQEFTLKELTEGLDPALNLTIQGDPNCVITGIATIHDATPGEITFLTNSQYRKYLAETKASAVILSDGDAVSCPINAIITRNPHYTYAKIAMRFERKLDLTQGIHPTVVVGENTVIHPSASIGPHCVIGRHVTIAAGVIIGSGCAVGDYSELAEDVKLDARVTVYDHVMLGKRTHIASGVVIGSDGFGFANHDKVWHRVPQLGGVKIGDDVDVGANTSIDRGAIGDTIIEEGVKIDNLVQIAHNVRIGAHSVIAGCVGIAGSATIGRHCMIGGASCITGHISICDNAIVTGLTGVSKSITEPGMYSSGIIGVVPHQEYRKNNARFYRLESLYERVKVLEATLKELTERDAS